MAIWSADEEPDVGHALIPLLGQEFRERSAGHGVSTLVERDTELTTLNGPEQTQALVVLAFHSRLGTALAQFHDAQGTKRQLPTCRVETLDVAVDEVALEIL